MASGNDQFDNAYASDEFSLESIMAEYKGTAFINGDKKTPPELLNEQAESIIREVLGNEMVDSLRASAPGAASAKPPQPAPPPPLQPAPMPARQPVVQPIPQPVPQTTPQPAPQHATGQANAAVFGVEQLADAGFLRPQTHIQDEDGGDPDFAAIFDAPEERSADENQLPQAPAQTQAAPMHQPFSNDAQPAFTSAHLHKPELFDQEQAQLEQPPYSAHPPQPESGIDDQAAFFFDNFHSEHQDTLTSIGYEVQSAMESGSDLEPAQTSGRASRGLFGRYGRKAFIDDEPQMTEEEVFYEPPLKEAAGRFAKESNSVSLRCVPAILLSILMAIMTFAFEGDMIIPFGIGRSQVLASGALMLSLLAVMILCVDIIIRGYDNLLKGAPSAETLILFSCFFSFLSGTFTLLGGEPGILPYCAVSAFSLTFASLGEKYNLRAMTETLKTAVSSAEPYGIHGYYNSETDKTVLKKAYNKTDGFYNNLMHPDVSEMGYRHATPILLIVALVLPIIAIIFRDGGEYFLHIFSAFFAVAAPFSALLAFSVPFIVVAKAGRKSGAAVAGWGGADEICFTDGACVTDDDLFPPGMIALNNPKLFDKEAPEKAIRYTASIIIESDSGLSRVFADLLKSEEMTKIRVEEFNCSEGGVSGLIRGELVETGSAAYMNLVGVRIPDGSNMKNAVYTAINKKLIVVFPIDYTPTNSVQGALISILKWRIKLFLAVRDFNVTPLMLSQKYKVSFEEIELIQAKDSYSFSDAKSGREGRMAAVLVREGLGPFAEVLTGSRLLKSATFVATLLSILTAAFGIIIVFYMCWSGAFLSVSAGNLLSFMLCMLITVLIVCGYVRCRS